MSEPFLGQITIFGGNYAPRNWALCQGQILSIAQNSALFSLLGTIYGGNGTTTFALPDLRGRVAIGFGQGPGLPGYVLGQVGGQAAVTLTANQMPAHNHVLMTSNTSGTSADPTNNYPAVLFDSNGTANVTGYTATHNTTLKSDAVSIAGGSQPISIEPPYLALNYIIAMQGTYPSRN